MGLIVLNFNNFTFTTHFLIYFAEWRCSAEIKAHCGSVNKVAWAHPEFGQMIASCSADRFVNIYHELGIQWDNELFIAFLIIFF